MKKYGKLPIICFFVIISLIFITYSNSAFAFNWPWDQGHDSCDPDDPRWGTSKETCDPCCDCKASPIFVKSGKLYLTVEDLSLPGNGPSLSANRTYSSQDPVSGTLGTGWSFNFGKQILPVQKDGENIVILRLPNGLKHEFIENPDGTYTTPDIIQQTLVKNPDGTYTVTEKGGTIHSFSADGQLINVVDRNNNKLVLSYDSNSCLASASNSSGISLSFTRGANGKIASISDPSGRTVNYAYDANGNLTGVTDPAGNTTTYTYDSNDRLTSITDARGNVVSTFTYDSYHRVASYTEKGETHYMTYVSENETEKKDSSGNTWTYYFDEYGMIDKEVDPLGNITLRSHTHHTATSLGYEITGAEEGRNVVLDSGVTATADSQSSSSYAPGRAIDGNASTFWYSGYSSSHYLQINFPSPVDVEEVRIENAYFRYIQSASLEFSNGFSMPVELGSIWGNYNKTIHPPSVQSDISWVRLNISLSTNYYAGIHEFKVMSPPAGGARYDWVYDDRGNMLSETDPLGNVTTYTYEPNFNQVLTMTDPMGHVTKYEYDANGNNIKIIRDFGGALENETTYTYDGNGNQTSMTDPMGNTTLYEYDANGNLTKITDALGNVTVYTYDGKGNKLSETDPLGNVTTYTYDLLNRITSVQDALGNTTAFTYDANSNITSMTDSAGNTTTFTYDSYNRLTQITNPLGGTIEYSYDSRDNLITMTDANNNTTSYTYDILNRKIRATNELGGQTNYTYGSNSNILTVTDANGSTTTNAYDALNNITKTTYPDGTFETFTYDADSNFIAKIDRNGNTINNTYDSMHRLTVKLYPDATTVNYTYDSNWNILTASNSDVSYAFTYDALNRVTQVTNMTLNKTVSYSYLCCGLKGSMTNPEGGVTTYTYDVLKRLTSLTNPLGETTAYTYDNLSRTVRKYLANGNYTTYSYDAANRLLSLINKTSSNSAISSYNYTYDNTSNRTSMTTTSGTHNYSYDKIYELLQATHPASSTETYTYDPVYNRLTSADYPSWTYDSNNRLTSFNGTSFTYDANGNTISKTDASGVTTYQYDYENKLTRIDYPDGTYSEYRYDPFGNRIKKDVNGTVAWYIYDLVKELPDVIAEYDNSGFLIVDYTHGPGIDEVLSMRRNGDSYFYLKDGLGSITSLIDNSEVVVSNYEYDAFGNVINQSGTISSQYGYTGRRLDSESGLMYYRERYYNPTVGRFSTKDPVEDLFNYYTYVGNNPLTFTDPTGLGPKIVGCGTNKAKVAAAAAKADAAFQTCGDCKDRKKFRKKIRNMTIKCIPLTDSCVTPGAKICGRAYSARTGSGPCPKTTPYTNTIEITPTGLNGGGCGCIQATVLHEATHLIGYKDSGSPNAYAAEKKCFKCASP